MSKKIIYISSVCIFSLLGSLYSMSPATAMVDDEKEGKATSKPSKPIVNSPFEVQFMGVGDTNNARNDPIQMTRNIVDTAFPPTNQARAQQQALDAYQYHLNNSSNPNNEDLGEMVLEMGFPRREQHHLLIDPENTHLINEPENHLLGALNTPNAVQIITNEDESPLSASDLFLKSVALEEKGDLAKSIKYLKKAADLNHPKSCYLLAQIYLKGSNGLKKSEEEYVKYLQRAEKLGNQAAINEANDLKRSLDNATQYLDESFMLSSLRKVSRGAKRVDVGAQYINQAGQLILSFLDIFYEDKVQTAERILSYCNMAGGFSKIIYGASDAFITGEYKHLWKSSYGAIQLGSAYLQHESIERREKIRKEREAVEIERKKISEELLSLEEKCEQNRFEEIFKEINERKKELCKQQCTLNNKRFCTAVAEKIFIDTVDEYQKNPDANLLAIMMGKTFTGVSNSIPILLRQNITANKEEVIELINNFVESVRDDINPKIFLKFDSVFNDIKKYTFESPLEGNGS